MHDRIAAERAQARYQKHYDFCKEVLEQVVDLATKAGEYRLFTAKYVQHSTAQCPSAPAGLVCCVLSKYILFV